MYWCNASSVAALTCQAALRACKAQTSGRDSRSLRMLGAGRWSSALSEFVQSTRRLDRHFCFGLAERRCRCCDSIRTPCNAVPLLTYCRFRRVKQEPHETAPCVPAGSSRPHFSRCKHQPGRLLERASKLQADQLLGAEVDAHDRQLPISSFIPPAGSWSGASGAPRRRASMGAAPLRVRGLDRAGLHADLTILAKLACALSRARALRRLTSFVWFS